LSITLANTVRLSSFFHCCSQKLTPCDQVCPKICHHTSNLLLHYLVRWTRILCQRCWNHCIIKDVTVKQVRLNITDMDKINIVSPQAVLKMFSYSTDTLSMSFSPLVNSLVLTQQFSCCTCAARCAVHCPVGTQSRYQTLCVSLAAVLRHYDVVKQHRRNQEEISPKFPAL